MECPNCDTGQYVHRINLHKDAAGRPNVLFICTNCNWQDRQRSHSDRLRDHAIERAEEAYERWRDEHDGAQMTFMGQIVDDTWSAEAILGVLVAAVDHWDRERKIHEQDREMMQMFRDARR